MLNTRDMIIACPACTTRYVVPDSAIGVDGRTVRCAKCRHSWFQDGSIPAQVDRPLSPPVAPPPPPPAPEPVAPPPTPQVDQELVAAPPAVDNSGWGAAENTEAAPATSDTDDAASPQAFAEEAPPPPAFAEESPPPVAQTSEWTDDRPEERARDDDGQGYSNFAHEPPFRPRINKLKLWTWAAAVFAVVALAAIGAVAWYGLPNWMPLARQTFAEAQPDLVLDFPANRQDRRTLPNGSEFFGASGTVTNVGRSRRTVPTILIVLRDARERIVYSWEVAPAKRQLAPGESVSINEAVTDVPKSAKIAEIGWKPG